MPLGTGEPPRNIDEQRQAFAAKFPELAGKRVILFLGRLHEKKGCDLLLRAFLDLLQSKPREIWQGLHLMMAGPTSHPAYLESLKQIAAQCEKLSPGSVSFPGMISGDLKWGTLREAEVFVLPSHQENFGIAVVEALGCGTPVLISRPVNIWREIESSGAGLVRKTRSKAARDCWRSGWKCPSRKRRSWPGGRSKASAKNSKLLRPQ